MICGILKPVQIVTDVGVTHCPDPDEGKWLKDWSCRHKKKKKKSLQLNKVAEECFVPIAHVLFMHPEQLMVRICSCTFDRFRVLIINLMWLNFIFSLRVPLVRDSFWLLGTKVSRSITPHSSLSQILIYTNSLYHEFCTDSWQGPRCH